MKLKLLQKLKGTLLLSGLCISGTLVYGQTYTFTNAGATGINGPTQLQVTNAYASTSLANSVTVTGGIQSWSVPVAGLYKIEVYGANGYGVYGGKGAYMSGEFSLNANDVLQILVGQMGGCCNGTGTNQYGGGGGSFVVAAGNTPLIVAGGGGGGATFFNSVNLASSQNPVADASITTSGKTASGTSNGTGGTAGNGGNVGNTGGGGGGFLTDGGSSTTALAQGGKSFLNGGMGANSTSALGGFGGGGGVSGQNNMRAGGGGGYSGGGGCGSSTTVPQIGGGGGSFNSGANQVNTAALGTGHGTVVITLLQALVIDLKDVSAVNIDSGNRIDWSTANEQSGDRFELESSADGKNFTHLARIDAKGSASSYNYWDENPFSGINYYRLKLVHTSGSTFYSKVVSATVKGTGAFRVEAYPNPVSDVLTVNAIGSTGSDATVLITDLSGKVIKTVSVTGNMSLINMAGLAQGVYFIKYSDSKQSQTIIVNKQ